MRPARPRLLSGCRVLIVEDETMIAMDLANMLAGMGAEVVGPAPNVAEALGLIADPGIRIDRAILDINLRGEEGYPVADALVARAVPFVFATGYDAQSIPVRYAAVPLFEKPIDLAKLARTLAAQRA